MAERAEAVPARLEALRLGLIDRIRAAAMYHEPIRGYALLSPAMVWMLVASVNLLAFYHIWDMDLGHRR